MTSIILMLELVHILRFAIFSEQLFGFDLKKKTFYIHFLDRVWLYKEPGYAQSPDVQVHSI